MHSTTTTSRILAYKDRMGWTVTDYARETNLSQTTLVGMGTGKWNPTLATLSKLESIIPESFRVTTKKKKVVGS